MRTIPAEKPWIKMEKIADKYLPDETEARKRDASIKKLIPAEKPNEWTETVRRMCEEGDPRFDTPRPIRAEKPTAQQYPTAMLESIGYHKGYKAAQAQAAQLAEALRAAQAWLMACSDKDYTYARQSVAIKASEALAAYEAAQ